MATGNSSDARAGDSRDFLEARSSPFIRWTIYRPVTVLMAFVALLVVGVVAYPRIRVQLAPPGLTTGGVSVYIPVHQGTPEEVMEQVARPTEELLRTIPGVREIFSASGTSRCYLRIEYDAEADPDTMTADIRERIDRARLEWPDGVDRYTLWRGRLDSDMPVYVASVGMDVDEERVDVNDIFERVIQNRLLAIDGVARVTFWGLIEKRVTIDLDNARVAAHGVPVQRLVERLVRDNRNVTGGKIRDGDREWLVRSIGKFRDFDEIRDYPVTSRLRVSDIALVDYYRAIRERVSRVNGLFSYVVVVHKDSIANTIEVCDRVQQVMETDVRQSLPRDYPGIRKVEMHSFLDQGEVIEVSIDSLRTSGGWGGVFAIAVLFVFFRRLGVTLLVTLAIPFSLLITVIWIYFRDGTFNILSLTGMSLGIGMLVDNSIVIVENIVRKQDGGLKPLPAAVEGVREVGLAVSLATLTTVVVFLPIMFLGDPRFKVIYQEVGGPLCVSVLASLLVALVFIPQGVIYLAGRGRTADGRSPSPATLSLPNRWTGLFLGWCLRNRFESCVLFGSILLTTIFAFWAVEKGDEMSEGSSRIELQVTLPKNRSLEEAIHIFEQLEAVFDRRRAELGIRSITSWFDARDGEVNLFFDPGVRIRAEEFFDRAKSFLPRIPDVRVELGGDIYSEDRWGERLRVFVRGNDFPALREIGDRVEAELRDRTTFPELSNVLQVRQDERDEVQVRVRREVADHYGIDARAVSNMVSWAIRGAMLPDFETEERELPFWIRYQDADKEDVTELNAIPVYRPGGEPVRLENVATFGILPGPGDIQRVNGKITLAYSADAETEDFFNLKGRVRRHLQKLELPEGFEISLDPWQRGFDSDMENTIFAMALALSLVFFVMGLLFESFTLPFSVLLSIPHAFFGSVWALYLGGVTLDPGAMVGSIMLVGIVVNNAIVLVDAINRRRLAGLPRDTAILEAVRIRFRPVWMTALTTICGLLPLALLPQRGEGMDYKSMAVVLIGGLTTSTFFTLFVVPLFYTLLDDLRRLALAVIRGHRFGSSGLRARPSGT